MMEDFSYSSICSEIDGNTEKGKAVIIELSKRYIAAKEEVLINEIKQNQSRQKVAALYKGISNALQALKKEMPLAVILDSEIIVITNKDISIETNCL